MYLQYILFIYSAYHHTRNTLHKHGIKGNIIRHNIIRDLNVIEEFQGSSNLFLLYITAHVIVISTYPSYFPSAGH